MKLKLVQFTLGLYCLAVIFSGCTEQGEDPDLKISPDKVQTIGQTTKTVPSIVKAVFGGGPFYKETMRVNSMATLKASGFTTAIVWTIHIDSDAGLNFNAEFPACEKGEYIGRLLHPNFTNDINTLKTSAGSSITRVEVGLSAWESQTFTHIKNLMATTEGQRKLRLNFEALKRNIPSIDAINFDDESTYHLESATAFAIMLSDLGYKVTLCPYSHSSFWRSLATNINDERPGTVDAVYLQSYAGGTGNSPCSSVWDFGNIPVYPGLWGGPGHDSPATITSKMQAWNTSCQINGGFIWLFDNIQSKPDEYASAINW